MTVSTSWLTRLRRRLMRAWAPSRDLRAGSLRVTAPGSAPTLTDGVVALDAHTLGISNRTSLLSAVTSEDY